jgi:hypothetical protein
MKILSDCSSKVISGQSGESEPLGKSVSV